METFVVTWILLNCTKDPLKWAWAGIEPFLTLIWETPGYNVV